MTTLIYKGYSITSSLQERNIFLKLVDQVSFATYEAVVEQKDLRIQHPLCSVYKVIVDTFSEQDENYRVDINLLSGFLKLEFHALVGGFLELRFEVVLREKVVATDALVTTKLEQQVKMLEEKFEQQLTINVDLQKKVEIMAQIMAQYMEKMQSKLSELQEQSEALSQVEINIGDGDGIITQHLPFFVKIGAKELHVLWGTHSRSRYVVNGDKLKYLYRLRKLTVQAMSTKEKLQNQTLEELEIHDYDFSTVEGKGLNISGLPNLKRITLLRPWHLTGLVAFLSAVSHKIESLTIEEGRHPNNTPINRTELQTYCRDNNIELKMY